jgi:hypothetical protein
MAKGNRMKVKMRMTGWKWFLCLVVFFPVMAAGSAGAMGSKGGEPPPSSSERAVEGKITIQKILKNPAEFANREIALEGAFQGWKGRCEDSNPLTRSDWILKDETGCIYVSGRIPSGVSTTDPRGEVVVLSGTLKVKEGGKPYFEAKEVRLKD